MRSRNDNNAAVLGSAGGLEERVHANMLREACDGTHCATRVISSRYLFRTFININLNIATDIASFIYI